MTNFLTTLSCAPLPQHPWSRRTTCALDVETGDHVMKWRCGHESKHKAFEVVSFCAQCGSDP